MALLNPGATRVRAGEANAPRRKATRCVWPRPLRLTPERALVLILVAAGALIGSVPHAGAQSEPPTEYQIKAAFLYNFAKFVEWPAEAFPDTRAAIHLCVVGEDPFGDVLEQTVSGKAIHGRPLAIKRLKSDQDLKVCQILFISSSEKWRLVPILGSLRGSSVLTVGETQRFAQLGGMINFILEESKVRFEINVEAAERVRLKMSAKLLSLARIVIEEHHGGND